MQPAFAPTPAAWRPWLRAAAAWPPQAPRRCTPRAVSKRPRQPRAAASSEPLRSAPPPLARSSGAEDDGVGGGSPACVDLSLFTDGSWDGSGGGADMLEGEAGEREPEMEVGNSVADELLRAAGYVVKPLGSEEQWEEPGWAADGEGEDEGECVLDEEGGDVEYRVDVRKQLEFERCGHCALPGLMSAQAMAALAQAVDAEVARNVLDGYRQKVEVLFGAEAAAAVDTVDRAIAKLDGVDLPFLQFFNLHQTVPAVADVALSETLGRVAADLLGVDAVRLYQDSVFWKRGGDRATPWHADCSMMPVDGPVVTIFLPLRTLAAGKHAPSLRFASGSHRDVGAAYWYGLRAGAGEPSVDLSARYPEEGHGAVALGGATAHHGFTLHCSPGIPKGSRDRRALSLCYVAAGARVLPKKQQAMMATEDSWSYMRWLPKAKAGKPVKHPLLPIVFSRGAPSAPSP
jgi:hypothetical protein